MDAANVLQRRWCAALLARTPRSLPRMRANIASSAAWLAEHPSRVLFPSHRERLARYDRLLDAHGVPMPSFRTTTNTKKQTRRGRREQARRAPPRDPRRGVGVPVKKCPKCRYRATVRMVIECTEGGVIDVWMCLPCAETFVKKTRDAGKLLAIDKFRGEAGSA